MRNILFNLAAAGVLAALLAGCEAAGGPYPWMSPDIKAAWDSGYKGGGSTITVVDSYNGSTISGNLTGTTQRQTHGAWTSDQAGLVAPQAAINRVDYNASSSSGYSLASGLNVVNNSYGYMLAPSAGFADLPTLEQSTVQHARNGAAVVVIAAGNNAQVLTAPAPSGLKDVLGSELVGAASNIFVGALSKNGTPSAKASSASYSNRPGSSATVQNNFVVVGVDRDSTGLAGTSFAAPIVSGYAAILGSKFTSATPTQITNQILGTARTDTIQGYSPATHGRGEASLSRALAPSVLQ